MTVDDNGEMKLRRKPSALEWSNLIQGLPTETVVVDKDGYFDEGASPHFFEWMKSDDFD